MCDEDKSKEELIQELAKVRGELVECQARFQTLVEHVPAITYTAALDATSATLYVSPQIERYLDVTQTEYVSDPDMWMKLLHPEDRERVMAEVARSHETGETFVCEYRMVARNGEVVWFRDEAAIVPDQGGRPGSLQGVMINVTEQKAARDRLQELREFNEKIISASPLGILTYRLDGQNVSANDAAGPIAGGNREALLQQNFRRLESWKRSGLLALAEAAISTRTPQRQVFHLTTTFGREVWLDCRFNLFDSSGETYLLLIVNDITELKQIETELKRHREHLEDLVEERTHALKQAHDALRQRTEDLQRANQELEHFAFVASHDLKEPLRKISNFTSLLEKRYKGKLDEKADQYIHYVVDGAHRMETLIDALLAYSRVGRGELNFNSVDMEAVLAQTLEDLQMSLEETHAAVSHDPLPVVRGNQGQAGQLLQNLIANAVKFRGGQLPRIHISAAKERNQWIISVSDQGIGFDPEHRERIFEIFRRLQTDAEYPGTGIGLAVCKKIVERHGGRIWAESEPGKGSVFYFTLPAQE